MKTVSKNAARLAGTGAVALGLVVLGAGSASAHVTVTPSTTAAGGYSVLTFSLGHGCDGSSTTDVTIQVPEEIVTVTPTINPDWKVSKNMEKLATPVDDGHGGQYTERVKEVVYTADTPLPDGFRDTFEISLKLPEKEGQNLVFPTVQTCEKGETAWIQVAAEGEQEPDSPAPAFTLTAAEGDGHGHSDDTDATDDTDSAASETDSNGSDALGWTGVGLGALGLAVGGTALARSRKTS